jgi:hypothetical protein
MIAYEIYRRDPFGEDCLLGVLPERRKKLERINEESVMKWARLLVNVEMTEEFFEENIYFIPVHWPDPVRWN